MKLYREQGAQGLDFSYLDAADKLARRRDILLEEALDEARHERPEEKLTDAGRRSGSLISLVLGAIFLGLAFYVNPYVFTNPVEILTAQGEGQDGVRLLILMTILYTPAVVFLVVVPWLLSQAGTATRKCPECGWRNPETAQVCKHCENPLDLL